MDNEKLKEALANIKISPAAIERAEALKSFSELPEEESKITNFEKIKDMTLNEMVQFMNDIENENIAFSMCDCNKCVQFNGSNKMNCDHCRFCWLLSEAE